MIANDERVGTIIARLAVRLGDVWVILVKTWVKTDHPYFPRRNRDLGMTISVKSSTTPYVKPYMWAIVTSAVYHPYMYMHDKHIYIVH